MSEEPPIEALKALAHPLRFQIIGVLAKRERNVGEIEDASGIGQPALSQQLAILRKAGLVSTRREAKQIYYAIERDELELVVSALNALLPEKEQLNLTGHASKTGAAVFARLNI